MRLYRDKIHVEPACRWALQRAGLDSVQGVLHCLGDHVVAWSRTSDTVLVRLADPQRALYIKRYLYPTWRQRVRGSLRGTWLRASRAKAEYVTLEAMRAAEIRTVQPVAWGERRVFGFLCACFLVTEAVPDAMSLLQFVQQPLPEEPASCVCARWRGLLASLAGEVRTMHRAGFVHGAMFWRNVLVGRGADGAHEFFFLDSVQKRRTRLRWPDHPRAIRDVASMMTLAPQFLSRTDCMRFARHYLQESPRTRAGRRWIHAVLRAARHLRPHELYRLRLQAQRAHGAAAGAATPEIARPPRP